MRYLMTFSYDGTNFYGYQKQPKLRTIEGELEDALTFINDGKEVISSRIFIDGAYSILKEGSADVKIYKIGA